MYREKGKTRLCCTAVIIIHKHPGKIWSSISLLRISVIFKIIFVIHAHKTSRSLVHTNYTVSHYPWSLSLHLQGRIKRRDNKTSIALLQQLSLAKEASAFRTYITDTMHAACYHTILWLSALYKNNNKNSLLQSSLLWGIENKVINAETITKNKSLAISQSSVYVQPPKARCPPKSQTWLQMNWKLKAFRQ